MFKQAEEEAEYRIYEVIDGEPKMAQRPTAGTPENVEFRLKLAKESIRKSGEKMIQAMLDETVKRKLREKTEKEKLSKETNNTAQKL